MTAHLANQQSERLAFGCAVGVVLIERVCEVKYDLSASIGEYTFRACWMRRCALDHPEALDEPIERLGWTEFLVSHEVRQ